MIHISEAEIGVLDLTGSVRQGEGSIKTLDCSYGFHASLVRSVIHYFLIGSISTYTLTGHSGYKL
ncbi:unnamed protein product [Schistosoma curassoni]|uniref:Uncharacterized protein n=1 Tax=Schistosoma curassoni TaxID=6186 RepID=A0A183K2P2_9TREM|nr:unnamed protein product [Schistosoma curassoni]